MISEIKITNRKGSAEINIEGVIGVPEQMQFDSPGERVATYERFSRSLRDISELAADHIVVNIRSTGGSVNDALLIYDALSALRATVTTRCYGYVASAATIIAQAASPGRREVSPSTFYLVHCSEGVVEGNSQSLSQTRELLDKTDERIASIYSSRSGRDVSAFVALMNENGGKGRWMTASETVDVGLADRFIGPGRVRNSSSAPELSETLSQVVAMLGLPLPEVPSDEGVLARVRSRLAAYFRLKGQANPTATTPASVAQTTTPQTGNLITDAVPQSLTPPVPDLRDELRRTAFPTSTTPTEDPGMDDYRPSPNQSAYNEDAGTIKNRYN